MSLPHPLNSSAPPTSGLTWCHWAITVIAALALCLVVTQLIFGFSPAGRTAFVTMAIVDLALAVSLLPRSSGA